MELEVFPVGDDEGGRPSSRLVYPGGQVSNLFSFAVPESHLFFFVGNRVPVPFFYFPVSKIRKRDGPEQPFHPHGRGRPVDGASFE